MAKLPGDSGPNCSLLKPTASAGASLPNTTAATMQSKIQEREITLEEPRALGGRGAFHGVVESRKATSATWTPRSFADCNPVSSWLTSSLALHSVPPSMAGDLPPTGSMP